MTAEKRYAVTDCDGCLIEFASTAEHAWESAEERNSRPVFHRKPYSVVELVPLERPVPPRPTATLAGILCEWSDGKIREVGRPFSTAVGNRDDVMAAADLVHRTEEWTRKYGGAS